MSPVIPPTRFRFPSVLLSAALAVAAPATHAALLAQWSFNEGSGTTAGDSSGNAHHGAILGGATWGGDTTRGTYLVFNGTDAVVNPGLTLPVMTTTNDFTWSFWANSQEAIGATQQNAVVLGNRYSGANNVDFAPRQFIKFTPTQFEWHQNANGNNNINYDDFPVGEWHHHAVVKTGTMIEYYFDGAPTSSGTLTEVIGTAENPLFIGGNPGQASVNEFFNGYIDEVRIYDNALSPAEVGVLAVVPEPSHLAACAATFGLLALRRRRR